MVFGNGYLLKIRSTKLKWKLRKLILLIVKEITIIKKPAKKWEIPPFSLGKFTKMQIKIFIFWITSDSLCEFSRC